MANLSIITVCKIPGYNSDFRKNDETYQMNVFTVRENGEIYLMNVLKVNNINNPRWKQDVN